MVPGSICGVSTPEGTTALWTGYAAAGNLVQDPTVQGQDTLCRRCRDCNHNTFETRRCEYGLDRLCQVRFERDVSLLLQPRVYLLCYLARIC